LIWPAPDGTAFVVGYFTGPGDQATADFPFPAMDNRNAPIALDKISARVLSDTHRRALCAAAAFTFGLGYELWAKEEVENPHREGKQAPEPACPMPTPATPTQSTPKSEHAKQKTETVTFASEEEVKAIQERILAHPKRAEVITEFKKFKKLLPAAKRVADHIQLPEDVAFLNSVCDSLEAA